MNHNTLESRAETIKRKWSEFVDCCQMHGTGMTILINDRSFNTGASGIERNITITDAEIAITVKL